MSYLIECPYCKGDIDPYDYDPDYDCSRIHMIECSHCERTLGYRVEVSYSFEAVSTPCQNDGNHQWKPTCTVPKCCTRMICDTCEEERPPTDEEREKYEIPSFEEYWQSVEAHEESPF